MEGVLRVRRDAVLVKVEALELAFRRDAADGSGVVCTVNLGDRPAALSAPGRMLLSSDGPANAVSAGLAVEGSSTMGDTIAADTAVWWAV